MTFFRRLALLSLIACFAACAKPTKSTPAVPIATATSAVAVPAPSPARAGECPGGGISPAGGQPLVAVGSPPSRLIACGFLEADEGFSGKLVVAGFDLFAIGTRKGTAKPIHTESELERALVYAHGEKIVVEDMIYFRESWVPAFRTEFGCTGGKCAAGKKTCVLKLPAGKSKWEPRQVKDMMKRAGEGKSLDESEVAAIKDLALEGDAAAKDFFRKGLAKLNLDGASAEEYETDRTMFKRLAGCK